MFNLARKGLTAANCARCAPRTPRHQPARHVAEGRIGATKRRIDGFLWFEGADRRMTGAVINQEDAERTRRLCALLNIDPKAIG
jgi:hypothetical protein